LTITTCLATLISFHPCLEKLQGQSQLVHYVSGSFGVRSHMPDEYLKHRTFLRVQIQYLCALGSKRGNPSVGSTSGKGKDVEFYRLEKSILERKKKFCIMSLLKARENCSPCIMQSTLFHFPHSTALRIQKHQ